MVEENFGKDNQNSNNKKQGKGNQIENIGEEEGDNTNKKHIRKIKQQLKVQNQCKVVITVINIRRRWWRIINSP